MPFAHLSARTNAAGPKPAHRKPHLLVIPAKAGIQNPRGHLRSTRRAGHTASAASSNAALGTGLRRYDEIETLAGYPPLPCQYDGLDGWSFSVVARRYDGLEGRCHCASQCAQRCGPKPAHRKPHLLVIPAKAESRTTPTFAARADHCVRCLITRCTGYRLAGTTAGHRSPGGSSSCHSGEGRNPGLARPPSRARPSVRLKRTAAPTPPVRRAPDLHQAPPPYRRSGEGRNPDRRSRLHLGAVS